MYSWKRRRVEGVEGDRSSKYGSRWVWRGRKGIGGWVEAWHGTNVRGMLDWCLYEQVNDPLSAMISWLVG